MSSKTSRLALQPTQLPIQWVSRALSLRMKLVLCEADHSPPPSAKVKNDCTCISTPLVTYRGTTLLIVCLPLPV